MLNLRSPLVFFRNQVFILPIMVLALGHVGRGVSNSLLFLYFLLGALSLIWCSAFSTQNKVYFDRQKAILVAVWGTMFVAAFVSSIYNDALQLARKEWFVYLLSASTMIFTLAFIDKVPVFPRKPLMITLGFLLLIFTYDLLKCLLQPVCVTTQSVSAMTIPVLFAFSILLLGKSFHHRMFVLFSFMAFLALILLLLADSRTEIMMLVALYVVIFAFGFKRASVLLIAPLIAVLIFIVTSVFLGRVTVSFQDGLIDTVYKLSTNRMDIWERAIRNPPENLLLGSGINNSLAYLPENKFKDALHNAFLEIWYETGFLGLGLWLLLFIMLLKNIHKVYRSAEGEHRVLYSAYLGSFVAVVVAGMLDKGYGSIYYEFFIFYLGAMLFILGRAKSQLN